MRVIYEKQADLDRKVAARFDRGTLVIDGNGKAGIVADGGVFYLDSQTFQSFGALGDDTFAESTMKTITLSFGTR